MEYDLDLFDCDIINNEIIIKKKGTDEIFKYDLINYNSNILENKIKLKIKELFLNKEQLLKTDLTKTSILKIKIDDEELYLETFKDILDTILIKFSAKKLKNISLFKSRIRDGEGIQSLYYIEKINISYPYLCANDCKREILNLIYYLDNKFEIEIRLKNGKIVKFNK
jgi:hypothetical protein